MIKAREFCQRLNLRFPIIQAPMAGVSTSELAYAVQRGGGLGSLGCGTLDHRQLEQTLKAYLKVSGETDRPLLNINFFAHQEEPMDEAANAAWIQAVHPILESYYFGTPERLERIYDSFLTADKRLDVLLEYRPQVVSFHFGLPDSNVITALKEAGIAVLATACHIDEAQFLEAQGVDYIVAQGYEAGGHRGIFNPERDEQISTKALVSQCVAECTTPIIAAGGIMTAADIRLMLGLGAAAVQLGTAFLLTPESGASAAYKQRLVEAVRTQEEPMITADISGRPARSLRNKLVDLGEELRTQQGLKRPVYPALYDISKQLDAAAQRGEEYCYGAFWAGAGVAQLQQLRADELVYLLGTASFE